jgi:mitochondrial fission protein ELM1
MSSERPTFPLIVHDDERDVLRTALRAFRDDLGHEEQRVAAIVYALFQRLPDEERTPLVLDAAHMKVAYSALHTLLDDSARTQQEARTHLRALLDRLPGEHDIRAIDLDAELARED